MTDDSPGRLVIISGPSGAGKSTIVRRLLTDCPLPLVLSVSATTRTMRPGERPGVDYHFLSDEEFQRKKAAGDFLEAKEVFGRGHWYGTLRETVTTGLNAGNWVVLEIDVQGALAVLEDYPNVATFFVHSGSLEELERRLRERGTETEESLKRRLEVARSELELKSQYRFDIVNDSVDRAVNEMCDLLKAM